MNRRFKPLLRGHEVAHTSELGWNDLENGKLLDAAIGAGFEVIVTVDRNMRHQQNLTNRPLGLITLEAPGIDLLSISPLASLVLEMLESGIKPGASISIGSR